MELYSRHGLTSHYANIPSGYYTLLVCAIFVCLVFITRRYFYYGFSHSIIRSVSTLNPWFVFLYFVLLTGFIIFSVFITEQAKYYSILTKRLGRISYTFTNLIIFVVLKEPLPVIGKLISYLEFIPLHKWLSRSAFLLGLLHGILFLLKWTRDPQVSLTAKLFQNKQNFLGLIIFIQCSLMLITSLKPIRRGGYNLFYFIHQITMLNFIILTPLHARPKVTFPFLYMNLIFLALGCINKVKKVNELTFVLDKQESPGSSLYIVSLSRESLSLNEITPGAHIRISGYKIYHIGYWLLPSHPYTIATFDENEIKLIIKRTKFTITETGKYTISGPFNNPIISGILDNMKEFDHVLLMAGGSGISFVLPIFLYLKKRREKITWSSLRMVWIVKNISDFELLRTKMNIPDEFISDFEVFITGCNKTTNDVFGEESDIELQNFIPVENSSSKQARDTATIKFGRVIWEKDLLEFYLNNERIGENDVASKQKENYLFGCGPESLLKDCKEFGSTNKFKVITELYSL